MTERDAERSLGTGRSGLGPDSMTNHVALGKSLHLSRHLSSHYYTKGSSLKPVNSLALIFSDLVCRLSDLPFFPILGTAPFFFFFLPVVFKSVSFMKPLWHVTILLTLFSPSLSGAWCWLS